MSLEDEQPNPTPVTDDDKRPVIVGLVRDDLMQRANVGLSRYGQFLRPNNGRDCLRDAYEEALDLAQYLRQAIYERDGR